jgi:hypothetical protein
MGRSLSVIAMARSLSLWSLWEDYYLCGHYGKIIISVVIMARSLSLWSLWQDHYLCGHNGKILISVVIMARSVSLWLLWQDHYLCGHYGKIIISVVIMVRSLSLWSLSITFVFYPYIPICLKGTEYEMIFFSLHSFYLDGIHLSSADSM